MGSIEDRLREVLAAAPRGVTAAWLFGSQARGTARPDSDADVAVLYPVTPPLTLEGRPFDLEDDLAGALRCRVHLVVLNDAPPELVHRVLRDGALVLDRDRGARIRFEVAARNAYFDLQPLRERYQRAVPR